MASCCFSDLLCLPLRAHKAETYKTHTLHTNINTENAVQEACKLSGPCGSQHPMLRPNADRLPTTAAICMLRSRSHLLAARDSPHCPSSSALLLKDELLDFEHLRSLLSSSVWPADASVEESARASTAVSMAAAAQAARGDRACLSHHLLQLCWLHALPASRAAQIATRSEFKGEANGCFVWVSVGQMTFFGLLRSSTPKHDNNDDGTVMRMKARATAPLESPRPPLSTSPYSCSSCLVLPR